jgi:hypothetical protein
MNADLHVEIMDKDVGTPHDDYIGKFKTSLAAGAKEAEIEGPLFRRDRGTFWLKVRLVPFHNRRILINLFTFRLTPNLPPPNTLRTIPSNSTDLSVTRGIVLQRSAA